jgi:hypothetical protein
LCTILPEVSALRDAFAPSTGGARGVLAGRDENGTEIFRIDRFRFLYYEPFFNMKNCQFQLVSQLFSTIFCTL